MQWYQPLNAYDIDSPALLIFPDRIKHNIQQMIEHVGNDVARLIPHVKTHKMAEVVKMQMDAGISRFKCATIAEIEMCLDAGAKFVLIAYQLTGPKIKRFLQLAQKYPDATLASLVDNLGSAEALAQTFAAANRLPNVFLDINNGMHRSGIFPDEALLPFYHSVSAVKNLNILGLHIYDGHIRKPDVETRTEISNTCFNTVQELIIQIRKDNSDAEIIMGGSPTFTPASLRDRVSCSPGTTLLWDWGYSELVPELDLKWAAVLMTRVISKPFQGMITLDLGHKSVGADNPLPNRVRFLNLENYEPVGHSEEHLVLKVENWDKIKVGDIFYGIPFHVCPSVAAYNEAHIIRNQKWKENWVIKARGRKITI